MDRLLWYSALLVLSDLESAEVKIISCFTSFFAFLAR
jgi:hypothetical protein